MIDLDAVCEATVERLTNPVCPICGQVHGHISVDVDDDSLDNYFSGDLWND